MYQITGNNLSIHQVVAIARNNEAITLSQQAIDNIKKSRNYVEKIVNENRVCYGINTGFGKFSDIVISKDELSTLQRNLIISHACGTGENFEEEIVRGIMLLRVNALSAGFSGVRLETVQTLVEMLNKGVHPVIPSKGSLGASGDLAPLSHMVLTLIGEGEAMYKGQKMTSKEAMNLAGIATIELQAKEGLALINGTQAMCAIACLAWFDAEKISHWADKAGALTMEALNGIRDAFNPLVHQIRGQKGQMETAKNILELLEGSERITNQGELRVQDAYTLRCIPQVHGPGKDTLADAKIKIENEINAVTDNPLIFPDEDLVISGGNFHGQVLALNMDFMAIAVAEFANISERRIERLVNPALSNLPAFLTPNGGLNSGFMIAQYVAAALVSENKIYAHPASVDSIPSSANQEDHVSMGLTAGLKLREIIKNTQAVLGIELVCAAQAIDLKPGKKLGKGTNWVYTKLRENIPFIAEDVYLKPLLDQGKDLIINN